MKILIFNLSTELHEFHVAIHTFKPIEVRYYGVKYRIALVIYSVNP